ncbi:hypothetical protein SDC9_78625 [bioreactor metagenome]|uniref:Uncharacterized protein n=1 Tax=bioreactor metagenome TaxID=1076179 RepID=A0A644YU62_9ZZZZ
MDEARTPAIALVTLSFVIKSSKSSGNVLYVNLPANPAMNKAKIIFDPCSPRINAIHDKPVEYPLPAWPTKLPTPIIVAN